MAPRYSEGYVKGVHDHDAALILRPLLELDAGSGIAEILYAVGTRQPVLVYACGVEEQGAQQQKWQGKLASSGIGEKTVWRNRDRQKYIDPIEPSEINRLVVDRSVGDPQFAPEAANYLFDQLSSQSNSFAAVMPSNWVDSFLKSAGKENSQGEI